MANHQPQGSGNGPPSAGMGMQHQSGGQGPPPPAQNMSQQNLNQIVIEYLTKKGYVKTEQTLRRESSHVDKDGRPVLDRVEDLGNEKYQKAFTLLSNWIEGGLDVYKFELRRLLWPIFVYSFLELIAHDAPADAELFLKKYSSRFEAVHSDELKLFRTIKLPPHITDHEVTKLYRTTKYRVPLNTTVYHALIAFLEANEKAGGVVILYLLSTFCDVHVTTRGPLNPYSFEAITSQAKDLAPDHPDLQEGIPGVFTGVGNKDLLINNAIVKLGMLPMEQDLAGDVRLELEKEDSRNPPALGQRSLVDEFEQNIKREDSADAPTRNEIPLPPSRARDVVMEVQKIKEHRERFKIESRTGGIGPGVSVCMWTFHNTNDCICCTEFSDDTNLVAIGTSESYIRVWNMHGEPLLSTLEPNSPNDPKPSSSRRLIGHSAPVYSLSFSPSILGPEGPNEKMTAPKLLLSSSSDKTIRLWSLETWTCLVVFKGHEGPVWNVRWGPFGHYFVSTGWDKTVRVWTQDHISHVRLLIGHDSNVSKATWHPNGAYVFSASDGIDKSVRMWSITTGDCVRIFVGHNDFTTTLECAPNGKLLASADVSGTIFLWDIAKGTLIKRCRGHGKGGIWSLSFSAESTVLVSGGADGTVRVWDVELPSDPFKGDSEAIALGGQANAGTLNVGASSSQPSATAGAGGKKKGKDTTITPDQISAFPTKKTPVKKVKFTRMNLVMAAGTYNG